jgi:hypothetical protein
VPTSGRNQCSLFRRFFCSWLERGQRQCDSGIRGWLVSDSWFYLLLITAMVRREICDGWLGGIEMLLSHTGAILSREWHWESRTVSKKQIYRGTQVFNST